MKGKTVQILVRMSADLIRELPDHARRSLLGEVNARFDEISAALPLADESLTVSSKTYTVVEAAARLGLSRNSTYAAIKAGQIPHVRIGSRILVSKDALDQMLGSK